jgi:hypothetical protein
VNLNSWPFGRGEEIAKVIFKKKKKKISSGGQKVSTFGRDAEGQTGRCCSSRLQP